MKSINDFGPIYTETNLESFPVEPFNTYSNLLFLAVVLYWFYQVLKKPLSKKIKTFLIFSLPVLLTGYIGGTIYHATRSHNIWLILDVAPILILSIVTAFYCWKRLNISIIGLALFTSGLIALSQFYAYSFANSDRSAISIGYFILIIFVIMPIFIYEYKNNFSKFMYFLVAVLCITTALFFRVIDSSDFVSSNIPIGTHWLWHSFGALCCHFLILYLKESEAAPA